MFGRLKAGVSLAAASDALVNVSAALVRHFPNLYSVGVGFRILSIRESLAGEQDRPALTLAATARDFSFSSPVSNVASLLIARSVMRRPEVQLRLALGASRWQLIRGSLTETLVYSLAGGIAGLAVAGQVNPYLRDVMPSVFSRELGIRGYGNGWLSIVVAVVLSVWTSLIAGLLPAITNATTNSDGVGSGKLRAGRSRRERFWMDCFVTLATRVSHQPAPSKGLPGS